MDYINEIPGCYSWEFLVGVCCPFSKSLALFQTKKCHFPHSFSDLALRQRLCHQYGFECISNSRISISFLFIWNCNDKCIHTLPYFPRKPYPIPDQSGQSVYKFSNQKGPKIQPFGAAHTYMADIRGSPPLRDECTPKQMRNATKINRCYLCSLLNKK